VADDVVAWLKKNPLPAGVEMTWGSDIKRQNDSFIYPFMVLFSIPVAVIGAFLALNLTMSNLSLFSLLGLIMLMGLVAKNAILLPIAPAREIMPLVV
jgi:hydrophobic/amphiphilic exporter-1 (mainly G- bacteria), HAE1 family